MNKIKNQRENSIFFSVILTTFNSELFIKTALRNLYSQTFKNFEIIMIDDGSSDSTLKIAKNYKNKTKIKFKIFALKHLGSPARSRNFGIKKSKGKFLCFHDCDDLFFKNKLEFLYKVINKKCSDVYYHNVYLTHKKKIFYCKNIDQVNSYKDLFFKGNRIILSSSCVKKSFLKDKNIQFSKKKQLISVEDYDFWLNIAKYKGKFLLVNKSLGANNLNYSSISKKRINHFLATWNVLKKNENNFKKMKITIFIRKIRVIISFTKIAVFEYNFQFLLFIFKFILFVK